MTVLIRIIFTVLALFALILAWQFALAFSQTLIAGKISLLFFTSLIFSVTSVVAGMIAYQGIKRANSLNKKQIIAFAFAYTIILLPSIVTLLALNHSVS